MKNFIIICVLLSSVSLLAQDRRGDKLKKIESTRIAFITNALELTPEESTVFWPIYNQYTDASKSLRKDMRASTKGEDGPRFSEMNDSEAGDILEKHLSNEQQRVDLKSELVNDLKGKIPTYKIIKLFFAEDQFKKEVLSRIKQSMSERGGARSGERRNQGGFRGN